MAVIPTSYRKRKNNRNNKTIIFVYYIARSLPSLLNGPQLRQLPVLCLFVWYFFYFDKARSEDVRKN